MIVLVFLVSLGIVSTYQTARLAYLFWPDPVNPAALATAAAAFLGVTYLVQYLVKVHHPIWIRENIFQEVFARCSSLCRWDLRIGLGIGTFLISTLSTFGRSCLWFEHKLEDALHSFIQLLTILPTAPTPQFGRVASPRTR